MINKKRFITIGTVFLLLLVLEGESDKVCQYYSVPKGGKQWPVDKIRELLSSGRSIGELIQK